MKLKQFCVTEFRSVVNSGWIDADRITAFIGTNESGKTNILLPLWKLNPADEGDINLADDLPRGKYHIYRDASPKPVFIATIYELSLEEQRHLSSITGRIEEEFLTIKVSRDFDGNYFWDFPSANKTPVMSMDEMSSHFSEYILALSSMQALPKTEEERRNKVLSLIRLAQGKLVEGMEIAVALGDAHHVLDELSLDVKTSSSFNKLDELKQFIFEKIDLVTSSTLSNNKKVIAYLIDAMPKYVYYSNYGNLDSQIYLPQVLQNMDRKDLGAKDAAKVRTLRTLFKFVRLNPKEIVTLGADLVADNEVTADQIDKIANKKKEREILLSSASASFTRSFNEWWKQGDYTFEFQADGNFFRIWVSDKIRPERIELEARSTGLQWFFSFYLVFLVESEQHHQNAILLLDEPGVTLHPLAQKDLFLFFENLATNNQMMYTTHSPFMVDSNHLERVRSVYIDNDGKTVVSPDLRASERLNGKNQSQSIYPAHAALGLTVSDTLLINCEPVLVEGESDQLYLSALKSLLISHGKISPLKELVFIPTGGVKGIKATAAILSGVNEVKPYVIVDGDGPGLKMLCELKSDFYAGNEKRLVNISQYTILDKGEIEDLFPLGKFAALVSKFLPRPEEVEEEFEDVAIAGTPICDQIEKYAASHQIILEKGWKPQLAATVKKEILKGKGKILSTEDEEYEEIVKLFQNFSK